MIRAVGPRIEPYVQALLQVPEIVEAPYEYARLMFRFQSDRDSPRRKLTDHLCLNAIAMADTNINCDKDTVSYLWVASEYYVIQFGRIQMINGSARSLLRERHYVLAQLEHTPIPLRDVLELHPAVRRCVKIGRRSEGHGNNHLRRITVFVRCWVPSGRRGEFLGVRAEDALGYKCKSKINRSTHSLCRKKLATYARHLPWK